jgi:hypothetical protein
MKHKGEEAQTQKQMAAIIKQFLSSLPFTANLTAT